MSRPSHVCTHGCIISVRVKMLDFACWSDSSNTTPWPSLSPSCTTTLWTEGSGGSETEVLYRKTVKCTIWQYFHSAHHVHIETPITWRATNGYLKTKLSTLK
jgi:hypothetical protein